MQIRLYDKAYAPLTTLLQSNVFSDFNDLEYVETLHQVGEARFTMRLDNPKTVAANLKHYNIVEIRDRDEAETPRWIGVIVDKQVSLNIVTVTCYGLIYLLQKRLTDENDSHTEEEAGDIAEALLQATNAAGDTRILEGTFDAPTELTIEFNRSTILSALKRMADAGACQFRVKPNRELDVLDQIGTDRSAEVIFQYDLTVIEAANILRFEVSDNGRSIVTKTYGKSGALDSTQENASLTTEFGLQEDFQNFRELGDQATVDLATGGNNAAAELSPQITLSTEVGDDFEVGDRVRLILKNRLIQIDDTLQIVEKRVRWQHSQKAFSIKVNDTVSDFIQQIKEVERGLDLLEREV